MNKETTKRSIKRQKVEGQTSLKCIECAEDDSRVIELHHVYGQNNSEKIVPLCKNCHFKITKEQNKLPRSVRSSAASREENIRFILVSVGALLEDIGKQLRMIGMEVDLI